MKRSLDVFLALVACAVLVLPALLIAVAVRATSEGPALHWSTRVGRHGRMFRMPKFRTMRVGTPQLPTDRMRDPGTYLTPIGSFLRRSSLDEIPQLWSVLKGDMSLVGPRPALFNQDGLVRRRRELGIDRLRPGITGWAQVNGRDEATEERKVELDAEYLRRAGVGLDLLIMGMTAWRVLGRHGVAH